MKKILFSLIPLALAASSASAANYVGGSVGSGGSIHYQSDLSTGSSVRYGLDLNAVNFNFNQISVGGNVDYLTSISNQNFGGLAPYYGFGLGAGVSLGSPTGVFVYPHVLGGLKYDIASTPLSVFGELNVGVNIAIGTSTGFGFGSGARIGLNYQLP